MQNLGLIPLINFAAVDSDAGLYRSAQPEYAYQYQWLKDTIGIDVIINLRSESKHDDRLIHATNANIEVINIDVIDHECPSLDEANYFVWLIKKCIAEKRKVLFHCLHGHGRTSTFCVLARIAQGWNVMDAIDEEDKVFHYSFRHESQKQFLMFYFS